MGSRVDWVAFRSAVLMVLAALAVLAVLLLVEWFMPGVVAAFRHGGFGYGGGDGS